MTFRHFGSHCGLSLIEESLLAVQEGSGNGVSYGSNSVLELGESARKHGRVTGRAGELHKWAGGFEHKIRGPHLVVTLRTMNHGRTGIPPHGSGQCRRYASGKVVETGHLLISTQVHFLSTRHEMLSPKRALNSVLLRLVLMISSLSG